MINLILLTGFLGAGKTTLMQEVLTAYKDKKVGVIVNEFGSINIDSTLIKRDGIDMAELSNGSIFCACIKDKFVNSLIEMSTKDLEYIFIEASGLADPSNISDILNGIKHKTHNEYDYKGSICVIDGERFIELFDLLPAIESQIEFCSGVIINKADLIDETSLNHVIQKISDINPCAEKFITSYCKVEIDQLMDCFKRYCGNAEKNRESSNTYETRPFTFTIKSDSKISIESLVQFLNEIVTDTFRIKGFADTDKGTMEISTVGKNINISPWHEAVEGVEMVVISAIGFKMMSVITCAIEKYGKGILHI
ncbi:CobW family GTP-binding protein [Anaerovorax sp. IOR16]|uniref:CobW family GTP-binding protein n=1 Tax=Anaerovorax sp. IOR16 TaxID=2773458 RepID=UPI0019CF525F|nr:GTP-binding protein [Anaerovorax sp. IOR16]